MSISQELIQELRQEAESTRKMLERIPGEIFEFKPHEKSMTIGRLSAHVAELPSWINATLEHDELDFTKVDYKPPVINTNDDLMKLFEETLAKAIGCLEKTSDDEYKKNWTLRSGDKVFFTRPKLPVIKNMVMTHLIHHRGQLSVFMRLNDIPLPPVYGPTADDPMM